MHCSYVAQHSSRHRLRHSPRVSWRRPWPDAFSQRAAQPAKHWRYLSGNQPVRRVYSSPSHFSAITRPSWLGRAVRNRHRHVIEQAARRWRGGRRFSKNATSNLDSTQAGTSHPFSCLSYHLSRAARRGSCHSRRFWQRTPASSQRPSRRPSRVRRNVVVSLATCPQSPWQRLLLRIGSDASLLQCVQQGNLFFYALLLRLCKLFARARSLQHRCTALHYPDGF